MLEGAEAHFDEIEVPTGTEDSTDDLLFDVTPMVSDTLSSGTPYLGEPERTPVADTWGRQRLRPSETPTAITSPEAVDRERANESVVQATTATPAPSWWQRRRTAFLFGVLVVLIPTVIWFLQRGG